MTSLRFTKMHGLGNDFIVFDEASAPGGLPDAAQWRRLSDRHTGIGFDQALVISAPRRPGTDVYYSIFNADGGEVEQCGNGARCVAEWLRLQGRAGGDGLAMDSRGGLVHAQLDRPGIVSLDMGEPRFDPASLPFIAASRAGGPGADAATADAATTPAPQREHFHRLQVAGREVEFAIASIGNPHAVLLVDDVATAPVAELGPAFQVHAAFPRRVNVGFLQVVDPAHVRLRVFERGVGETQACGTGACAAVAVGRKAGRLAGEVEVALPGGTLSIRWAGPGERLWMTGPAQVAFQGQVEL
jgi:diaminopimelate epimerase